MSREALVAALQMRPVPFTLAGQPVTLRPLTAAEVADCHEFQNEHGTGNVYQFLFVRSVCDLEGNRLFADTDGSLVATFAAAEVDQVTARVMAMNRMIADDSGKARSPTGQS